MKRLVLPLILILAFLLRVLWLDKLPVGFTPDEASFGYDAYSILKTGKDQWGRAFPLVLESFGDFKAPLYSYILTPFVFIFGLEKWVVRLPNALLGTAAVYVTYLLVRELGGYGLRVAGAKGEDNTQRLTHNRLTALTASILLAISPWHVMMNRGAFEANLTTFFLPLGIYLFLKGLKKNQYLAWSALILGLNLFTYHSAKLVTPLIILVLLFVFRNDIKKICTTSHKHLLLPSLILGIFLLLGVYTFTKGAGARARDVSIFQGALEEQAGDRLKAIEKGVNPFVARLLHNKYQVVARRFFGNYKQYFSFKFLFTDGPAETTYGMLPGRGVLYWFELPFLLGFFLSLFGDRKKRELCLIGAWLFLAPIPASLAMGVGYHANRAAISLPAIQVALAFGAIYLFDYLKKRMREKLVFISLLAYWLIVLFSFASFIKGYFVFSPFRAAQGMLYGRLEVAQWLADNVGGEEVVISTSLSEPHIYIAFAQKWDPKDYQKETQSWDYKGTGLGWVDQMAQYNLGNYIFKKIEWDKIEKDSYLVGKPEEFPESTEAVKVFYYPNGEPAILIISPETNIYAGKNS